MVMQKSDLKDGMIVKYRNGKKRMFVNNILLSTNNYNVLDNYREDLTNEAIDTHDIVEIFEFEEGSLEDLLHNYTLKPIWKRDETDWSKVPFGTRVRVWDEETYGEKFEGKFLEYAPEHDEYPFRVYTEEDKDIGLWGHCELIEEPKEEITYEEVYENYTVDCNKWNDAHKSCMGCINFADDCAIKFILNNYNVTRK